MTLCDVFLDCPVGVVWGLVEGALKVVQASQCDRPGCIAHVGSLSGVECNGVVEVVSLRAEEVGVDGPGFGRGRGRGCGSRARSLRLVEVAWVVRKLSLVEDWENQVGVLEVDVGSLVEDDGSEFRVSEEHVGVIVAHVALVCNGVRESVGVSLFVRVMGIRPRRRVGEPCRGDHAQVGKVAWYVACGLVAFVFAVDVVFVCVAYAVVFPRVSYSLVGGFPPIGVE